MNDHLSCTEASDLAIDVAKIGEPETGILVVLNIISTVVLGDDIGL